MKKAFFKHSLLCRCDPCFCEFICVTMADNSKLTDEERTEIREQFEQVCLLLLIQIMLDRNWFVGVLFGVSIWGIAYSLFCNIRCTVCRIWNASVRVFNVCFSEAACGPSCSFIAYDILVKTGNLRTADFNHVVSCYHVHYSKKKKKLGLNLVWLVTSKVLCSKKYTERLITFNIHLLPYYVQK